MKEPITNGIIGLFEKYPETAKTLKRLAQDILQGPSSLNCQEREMIATYVSGKNRCYFCSQSHGAIARALGVNSDTVQVLIRGDIDPSLPERMRYLLMVADYAVENRFLPLGLLTMAEKTGISESEIHDAVLVAATFSLFNRYVDLLSRYPSNPEFYKLIGERIAKDGYL